MQTVDIKFFTYCRKTNELVADISDISNILNFKSLMKYESQTFAVSGETKTVKYNCFMTDRDADGDIIFWKFFPLGETGPNLTIFND